MQSEQTQFPLHPIFVQHSSVTCFLSSAAITTTLKSAKCHCSHTCGLVFCQHKTIAGEGFLTGLGLGLVRFNVPLDT